MSDEEVVERVQCALHKTMEKRRASETSDTTKIKNPSHLAGVSLATWLQRLNATIGRLVLGSARFRNMFLLGTLVNSVNPKPSTLNVRAWALGFGPHPVRMFWSFGSGFASCNPYISRCRFRG